MPRNFNLSALRTPDWRDSRNLVRIGLGVLIAANLIAAAFVLHIFGKSAQQTADELSTAQRNVIQQRKSLERTRQIAGKVQTARGAGDQFMAEYMTPRRSTYSTLVAEMQGNCEIAGLTWKEASIAPLEPIKGSEDLSMMTITVSVEGNYGNLLKLINLVDRSPRFLVVEQLTASPQPNGKTLSIAMKLDTFVRDDAGGAI